MSMPLMVGASLLGALGKGVSYATDPYRKYNHQQIADLKAKVAAGIGLTAEEQAAVGNSTMAPARTLLGQDAMEQARLQATTGGQGGGAAAAALADRTSTALGRAGTAAGQTVSAADIAARGANKAELESRIANAAAMRNDFLSSEMKGIGQAAGAAGQMMGAKAVGAIPGALGAANMAKAAPATAGAVQGPAALGQSIFGKAPAPVQVDPRIMGAGSDLAASMRTPAPAAGSVATAGPTLDDAVATGDYGMVMGVILRDNPGFTLESARSLAREIIQARGA